MLQERVSVSNSGHTHQESFSFHTNSVFMLKFLYSFQPGSFSEDKFSCNFFFCLKRNLPAECPLSGWVVVFLLYRTTPKTTSSTGLMNNTLENFVHFFLRMRKNRRRSKNTYRKAQVLILKGIILWRKETSRWHTAAKAHCCSYLRKCLPLK